MRRINSKNINTKEYWDKAPTTTEFGLREKKYDSLVGRGEKIIDLGCGMSPFIAVETAFKEKWGLDFSPITIEEARKKYPYGVNYVVGNAIDTPFKDKYFDVSVAGELIEHLEEPEKLIAEMMRITKRRIILSTAKMEYNDPEHLWEFDKDDFPFGKVEEVKSKRFPGRSYLFITIDL